jgi:gamma-glutamylcyclotransferase
MLYFAYGSNMLFNQMRERCPSTAYVCVAALDGYRLAFTKRAAGASSPWRGFGVADNVVHEGERVWGAVFEINEREIRALDRSEGYRPGRETNAYRRVEVQVARHVDSENSLLAHTYVVCTREEPNPVPHRDYVARIVVGAKSWNIPADYLQALERIEVSF